MNSEQPPENPQNPDVAPSVVKLDMDITTARNASEPNGLLVINGATMTSLVKLGIIAGNYGLAKIAGGALICSMQGATEMQQKLVDMANREKISDKTVIAAAFAHAALTKSVQGCALAVNTSGLASGEKDKQVRRVFGAPKVVPKPPSAAAG